MQCLRYNISLIIAVSKIIKIWLSVPHLLGYVNISFVSWIKIDQLDVTCFIISLFTAQHVSNVNTYNLCTACFSLHKDTTPPQPNHTVTPTYIEPEQYNTWNKSTISRKLLKMDVLTFETCWAVNSEIIEQVTSSWSIFIQLSRWCTVQ